MIVPELLSNLGTDLGIIADIWINKSICVKGIHKLFVLWIKCQCVLRELLRKILDFSRLMISVWNGNNPNIWIRKSIYNLRSAEVPFKAYQKQMQFKKPSIVFIIFSLNSLSNIFRLWALGKIFVACVSNRRLRSLIYDEFSEING